MYGAIHENLVLYRNSPRPGHRYRQIVVGELNQFGVLIFEGDVIQPDPKFDATSDQAEVTFHPSLESAMADAKKEYDTSIQSGWIPYAPG
jgi:hypothetical protein